MVKAKIYCKTEAEKQRLHSKYPNVNATWLKIPKNFNHLNGPVVCKTTENLDRCPVGEKYIKELA